MSQFVSQDRFGFFRRHFAEQCVEQYNALIFPKTGHVGVPLGASFRGIHNRQALRGKPDSAKQSLQSAFEFAFGQRSKFIKERSDKSRIYPLDRQNEEDVGEPSPEPPESSCCIPNPKNSRENGNT